MIGGSYVLGPTWLKFEYTGVTCRKVSLKYLDLRAIVAVTLKLSSRCGVGEKEKYDSSLGVGSIASSTNFEIQCTMLDLLSPQVQVRQW
jgi:hypothetical protein